MSQTQHTENFGPRELLVIDEGHNIEPQLLSFVSCLLRGTDLDNLDIPELDDVSDYINWIKDKDILKQLSAQSLIAKQEEDAKKFDYFMNLISKVSNLLTEMETCNPNSWIAEWTKDNNGTVSFKPIFIHNYTNKLLFDHAQHVLIMSATILNARIMTQSLNIPADLVSSKRINSTFPVKNHPIYYKPVCKIIGGVNQQGRWGPPLIKAVNQICLKMANKKGIIHTHNMAIARMLLDQTDKSVSNRMLFQEHFRDKQEMLKVHAQKSDSIIIAPAMHEGVDLKDDLSRFQIICKVPFPNFFEDKQLAARKDIDEDYYKWLTALKLVQSVGRSIRSETDWAYTFILDESFKWWYKDNQKMLPEWFKNSVHMK